MRNRELQKKKSKQIQKIKEYYYGFFSSQNRLEKNMEANALVKASSTEGSVDEFDEIQYMPSIDLLEVQQIEDEEN